MNKHLHLGDFKKFFHEGNILKFQKKIKNLTFLMATITLLFFSFAVSAKPVSINNSDEEGWILDTIVNKVAFYHKIVLCGDYNSVLLKFDNQNQTEVSVSWKESFKTKQMPNLLEGYNGVKTLNLKAGINGVSSCEDLSNPLLIIKGTDVNPTFIADIIDFNFIDITIK